jgi:prolyl-tRNA synthetase
MPKEQRNAITPTRAQDYPEWYQQVVAAADLAETSPVRGCMVIKPWGYAIWERMQAYLDARFKETGHTNAYFPLFIPVSFLEKEAKHVDGFAKECAVVTHHRLEVGPDGKLVPTGELEEPLVVRPTSETIIGAMFAKWVQSYKDLPILVNQWANVVRWEMRTRLFLRTTEFLWQEGHTAHASEQDAREETARMLEVYRAFVEEVMAIPVIVGEKTAGERFPGAVNTYTIETLMQDGKALQAGTSHFLGQNFAKAQAIQFTNAQGEREHAWTTSWGVSTRLIGALVMSHSDDDGLVLPPRLAPAQVVLVPIVRSEEDAPALYAYCESVAQQLRAQSFAGEAVRVLVDTKGTPSSEKVWKYVKQGVPLRIEIGKKELEANAVCVSRRTDAYGERRVVPVSAFAQEVANELMGMQGILFDRAVDRVEQHTVTVATAEAFRAAFEKPDVGFVRCYAADTDAYAAELEALKVTPRCMPLAETATGTCIFTGAPNARLTVFARNY